MRKTVAETDVYLFAGITGDFSGVHVDEEFSKGTRFGQRIAHGALLVGFVSTVMARMTALLPPPGGVSSRYAVKFVAPVLIGGGGKPALAGPGALNIADARRFQLEDVVRIGPDVRLTATPLR